LVSPTGHSHSSAAAERSGNAALISLAEERNSQVSSKAPLRSAGAFQIDGTERITHDENESDCDFGDDINERRDPATATAA